MMAKDAILEGLERKAEILWAVWRRGEGKRSRTRGFRRWYGLSDGSRDKLVNGGFGVLHKPVDGFAWAVIAESVLDVVELNGGVSAKANAAVSWAFCSADFTVSIFATRRANNVAALHLYELAGGFHIGERRRRWREEEMGIIGGRRSRGDGRRRGRKEGSFMGIQV